MSGKQKILFVCTANKLRSRTAEVIFGKDPRWVALSAGTDPQADRVVNREVLEWADLIFVMEKSHRNWIGKKFRDIYKSKPIKCLYIPDEYDFMDPVLQDLLQEKVTPYLSKI